MIHCNIENNDDDFTTSINNSAFVDCSQSCIYHGGDLTINNSLFVKYKYSGSNTINDIAWYYSNSKQETSPVGTKKPNILGIYDLSGNIQEWCFDGYSSFGTGELTNPIHWSGDKCLRGGGFYNTYKKLEITTRCYGRYDSWNIGNSDLNTYNINEIGIRIARNAE